MRYEEVYNRNCDRHYDAAANVRKEEPDVAFDEMPLALWGRDQTLSKAAYIKMRDIDNRKMEAAELWKRLSLLEVSQKPALPPSSHEDGVKM